MDATAASIDQMLQDHQFEFFKMCGSGIYKYQWARLHVVLVKDLVVTASTRRWQWLSPCIHVVLCILRNIIM